MSVCAQLILDVPIPAMALEFPAAVSSVTQQSTSAIHTKLHSEIMAGLEPESTKPANNLHSTTQKEVQCHQGPSCPAVASGQSASPKEVTPSKQAVAPCNAVVCGHPTPGISPLHKFSCPSSKQLPQPTNGKGLASQANNAKDASFQSTPVAQCNHHPGFAGEEVRMSCMQWQKRKVCPDVGKTILHFTHQRQMMGLSTSSHMAWTSERCPRLTH